MASKLIQRCPLLRQLGIQCCPPAGSVPPTKVLTTSPAGLHSCGRVARRSLATVVSDSIGLHKDSIPRFCMTQRHQPSAPDEQAFQQRLDGCSSSSKVFKLLHAVEVLSDTMAAAALHRVADLELEGLVLKDPLVLENNTIRALFLQLEQESQRLTDTGLLSALLACTRLFLDPSNTLMVQLVSECQVRLDGGRMSVGQLCTLGQAMLAMEGGGSEMLKKVMDQIQKQKPAQWSLKDLVEVYGLLERGVGADGKYRGLLNAMHTHATTVSSCMDAAAVSGLLSALLTLNQTQAVPLMISLCKQAVRHVHRFTDEELGIVLGALMHFGHSDPYFEVEMERHVPTMAFTSHPETVTKVMDFFGQRNILSPAVFDAVAESFVYRAEDYSTSQVARQIVPFGKLGYLPPNASDVFRKVETILRTRFSQFQPETLLNLLHSCILVERFPVNFISKVFSNYFLQQLQDEGTKMDWTLRAQLTQLSMSLDLECPFYKGPKLLSQFHIMSFLKRGKSLESQVDSHLYHSVKNGLLHLLGDRTFFGSKVMTPYYYTLDVEIKLDEEGFVLPAKSNDTHKRIALCIDGHNRFSTNKRQLLGQEAIKQRHLRLLGYEVVQIPFYEMEQLQDMTSVEQYLHKKIFPHSYRLGW